MEKLVYTEEIVGGPVNAEKIAKNLNDIQDAITDEQEKSGAIVARMESAEEAIGAIVARLGAAEDAIGALEARQAEHVPEAAGDAPTAEEFKSLLDALISAGLMQAE